MSERTVEQALVSVGLCRKQHPEWAVTQYEELLCGDVVMMADEILRLRAWGWRQQALAILGANRDHMKPEDVAVIQNFIAGGVGVDTGVGKP